MDKEYSIKKIILYICLGWIILGFVPFIFVLIGSNFFSLMTSSQVSVAGDLGDSFGFVSSFFSSLALIFVVYSIQLQRKEIAFAQNEWKENTKSQQEQSYLMQESSKLVALNNMIQYYSNNQLNLEKTETEKQLSFGVSNWANQRVIAILTGNNLMYEKNISESLVRLKELSQKSYSETESIKKISVVVGTLVFSDMKLLQEVKNSVTKLYSFLMYHDIEEIQADSNTYENFKAILNEIAINK